MKRLIAVIALIRGAAFPVQVAWVLTLLGVPTSIRSRLIWRALELERRAPREARLRMLARRLVTPERYAFPDLPRDLVPTALRVRAALEQDVDRAFIFGDATPPVPAALQVVRLTVALGDAVDALEAVQDREHDPDSLAAQQVADALSVARTALGTDPRTTG